jgi:hypothetical protein
MEIFLEATLVDTMAGAVAKVFIIDCPDSSLLCTVLQFSKKWQTDPAWFHLPNNQRKLAVALVSQSAMAQPLRAPNDSVEQTASVRVG